MNTPLFSATGRKGNFIKEKFFREIRAGIDSEAEILLWKFIRRNVRKGWNPL